MEFAGKGGHSITIPFLHGYDENQNTTHYDNEGERVVYGSREDVANAGTTSVFMTWFNGVNSLSGVGMLSVSYALASGGWVSLILLLIIATSTFYTGLLIQRCMDADPNIRSYPDIGDRAFGTNGRMLVSLLMNLELYIVSTGFLILEGDNLLKLLPDMEFNVAGLRISGRQGFVIIVGLIILPSVWMNSMSLLSYVSASGVLASIILLASILWSGTLDGVGFHQRGTTMNLNGVPTAVSLFSFCYCSHPVFPTLYTSTKNKNHFSMVMFLCFLFCTILYLAVAILGYLMFGSNVQSQITLNLPAEKLNSRIAIYTTLVTPIAKFALMVTPIVNSIENTLRLEKNNRGPFRFFIRTALVFSSVVVAMTIPLFGDLMSLVGAFLSATASITLPCLCYLKISGPFRSKVELVLIGCIVSMGITIVIVGTYTSVMQILHQL